MKGLTEDDVLLTPEKVAKLTGIKRRTLNDHRYRGQGLPYIKIGQAVRYRLSAVRAYLRENEHNTPNDFYGGL